MKTSFISVTVPPDGPAVTACSANKGSLARLSEVEPLGFVWKMMTGGAIRFVPVQVPTATTGKISFHLHWLSEKNSKPLGSFALVTAMKSPGNETTLLQVHQSIVNQKCSAMRLEIADFGDAMAPAGSVITSFLFLKMPDPSFEITILGLDMVVEVEEAPERKPSRKRSPVARKRK